MTSLAAMQQFVGSWGHSGLGNAFYLVPILRQHQRSIGVVATSQPQIDDADALKESQ
jgi:hypothetical protein